MLFLFYKNFFSYIHSKDLEREMLLLIQCQDFEKAYELGLKIKEKLLKDLEKAEKYIYKI